jgi:hypothetical protein
MTASQLNIDFARKARDRGIKQAVKHADQAHESWSEKAYGHFVTFVSLQKGTFKVEDFREFSRDVLPDPPSLRAFGALPLRAARAGLIKKVGVEQVRNVKAHMAKAAVWEKVYP